MVLLVLGKILFLFLFLFIHSIDAELGSRSRNGSTAGKRGRDRLIADHRISLNIGHLQKPFHLLNKGLLVQRIPVDSHKATKNNGKRSTKRDFRGIDEEKKKASRVEQCQYDPQIWRLHKNASITRAVMFDRSTGGTCEECLEKCTQAQHGSWRCRSLTYDWKWSICDLFAVTITKKPFNIVSYEQRSYFEYIKPLIAKKAHGVVNEKEKIEEEKDFTCVSKLFALAKKFKNDREILKRAATAIHGVSNVVDKFIMNTETSPKPDKSSPKHSKNTKFIARVQAPTRELNVTKSNPNGISKKIKIFTKSKAIQEITSKKPKRMLKLGKLRDERREKLTENELLTGLDLAAKLPKSEMKIKTRKVIRRHPTGHKQFSFTTTPPFHLKRFQLRKFTKTLSKSCLPSQTQIHLIFENSARSRTKQNEKGTITIIHEKLNDNCTSICDQQRDNFHCKSFTNFPTHCEMSEDKIDHKLPSALVTSNSSVYVEKLCIPDEIDASMSTIFAVRDHLLVGFVEQVETTQTFEECIEFCVLARERNDHKCKSAMWYGTDTHENCLLNSESRRSRPQVFTKEDVPMIYFELPQPSTHKINRNIQRDQPFPSKWTQWSLCGEKREKYRFKKCSLKDIRKCVKQRVSCE